MASVETAPASGAKPAAQRDPNAPVTFTMEQIKLALAPKTRRYWVGITEDAPFDTCSKAGIGLMKYKGPAPTDDDGSFNPSKIQARGDIHEMTADTLAKFTERVANVVVRVGTVTSDSVNPKTGKPRQTRTVTRWMFLDSVDYDFRKDREGKPMDPRTFTFTAEDVPLGHFIYCVPLRESMPIGWREEKTPPRMCDVSSMVKAG